MLADILKSMGKELPVTDEMLQKKSSPISDAQNYASVEVEARGGNLRVTISIESHSQNSEDTKLQPTRKWAR